MAGGEIAPNAGSPTSAGIATAGEASTTEPKRCPVCSVAFDSVSTHDRGLMVNLLDNERYRRVCVEPVGEDEPRIRFYHHTHEQATLAK